MTDEFLDNSFERYVVKHLYSQKIFFEKLLVMNMKFVHNKITKLLLLLLLLLYIYFLSLYSVPFFKADIEPSLTKRKEKGMKNGEYARVPVCNQYIHNFHL